MPLRLVSLKPKLGFRRQGPRRGRQRTHLLWGLWSLMLQPTDRPGERDWFWELSTAPLATSPAYLALSRNRPCSRLSSLSMPGSPGCVLMSCERTLDTESGSCPATCRGADLRIPLYERKKLFLYPLMFGAWDVPIKLTKDIKKVKYCINILNFTCMGASRSKNPEK